MGLGKSGQSLWWADKYLDRGPVLIICPANIKETWKREARKHLGKRVEVLGTRKPRKGFKLERDHIYVINYDVAVDWLKALRRTRPRLIILDEAHYLKSPSAKRTKACQALCLGVRHIIALTGTPVLNRPAELWTIINLLRPDIFNSRWSFLFRYCAPVKKFYGWEFKGATNLEELNELLKATVMVRRLKRNVLHQLPPKTRSVIPVELSNRKEYQEAEQDFIRWLMKKSKRRAIRAANAERVVKLGYLKRLAGALKLKAAIKWIEDFLEQTGEKLLVFGIHKKVLKALKKKFGEMAVLITGSTSLKNRQIAMDRFNNAKSCRLCIANIDAGGVGWSCKSASTVAFIELDWVPGKHTQAEDRIHGVGRGVPGFPAMIYYLVAKGTIEEMLCKILQVKQDVVDRALDGKPVSRMDIMDQLESFLLVKAKKRRRIAA